jgi:lipopolysaccharide heptosyltransferase II
LKKFLIVNPFGIGDVLFTTPVIRAIKDSYPDSLIGYWCNERAADILKDNHNIDRIFALSRGDLKKIYRKSIWQGLRRFFDLKHNLEIEKFDTLFDFSLDHRYSLLAKIIGIERRLGFNYKNRGKFLTDRININGYSDKHAVEYYLQLLQFIGLKPKNVELELTISDEENLKSSKMFLECGITDKDIVVGVAPGAGASWGKDAYFKHWPGINFAQFADRVIDGFKAKVIILGDESERPIADTILKNMRNKPLDFVGKTSLKQLCAVINKLHILVTNDGGPLHIGVALGKKTISFFGPVDPKVYGPYPADEKRHIVLSKAIECSPCYANFRLLACKKDRECLETIDVDQAWDAFKRLL